jgi:hypothetical protein
MGTLLWMGLRLLTGRPTGVSEPVVDSSPFGPATPLHVHTSAHRDPRHFARYRGTIILDAQHAWIVGRAEEY